MVYAHTEDSAMPEGFDSLLLLLACLGFACIGVWGYGFLIYVLISGGPPSPKAKAQSGFYIACFTVLLILFLWGDYQLWGAFRNGDLNRLEAERVQKEFPEEWVRATIRTMWEHLYLPKDLEPRSEDEWRKLGITTLGMPQVRGRVAIITVEDQVLPSLSLSSLNIYARRPEEVRSVACFIGWAPPFGQAVIIDLNERKVTGYSTFSVFRRGALGGGSIRNPVTLEQRFAYGGMRANLYEALEEWLKVSSSAPG